MLLIGKDNVSFDIWEILIYTVHVGCSEGRISDIYKNVYLDPEHHSG